MRYLFVVDTLSSGGAGRVVSELANRYSEEHEVYICTFGNAQVNYRIKNEVNHIDGSKATRICGNMFLGRLLFLKKNISLFNPDVIISFLTELNINTILACSGKRVKVIVSERNDPTKTSSILKIARSVLYNRADYIVCQTKEIVDYFPKPLRKKCLVIPNPINPEISNPYDGERDKRIVMVGRLNCQKNYPLAFDAFKSVADRFDGYVLEVYGDGPLKIQLQNYINRIGMEDKIILKGHVNKLFEKIKTASLYIMSSDYEGMPNALMEAMALGLPCISTNHDGGGALSLIKDHENAIIVPKNDAQALSKAIVEVIESPGLVEKLHKNSSEYIRSNYCIENIYQQWNSIA